MPLNIPQNGQSNEVKQNKRGKKKVKGKTTFDGLTQPQKIDALREAVVELMKAIEGGANGSS